jgi:hypothetical protein
MATFVYDPNEVDIIFGGFPLSGFADGEFVTIEEDSNAFNDVVGTDGQVTRSKSNDRRATVTVKLMQSSPSNGVLSSLHQTDKNSPNGAGIATLEIKDKSGTSLHRAREAWIQKSPDVSYDREPTSREWPIRCASLQNFVGSN